LTCEDSADRQPEEELSSVVNLQEKLGWLDLETGYTVVVAEPSTDADLWGKYLEGALHTYSKDGNECALELDFIRDGLETQLFFAVLDENDRVVAGSRVKRRSRSACDTHAVREWAGNPGLPAVRRIIEERLPFGVVEAKTAWADTDIHRRGSVFLMLVRTPVLAMHLLDVRFVLGTAAGHLLDFWSSSGAMVAQEIPAASYPDERYQTRMIWWDRSTYAKHADPQQLQRVRAESTELMRNASRLDWFSTHALSSSTRSFGME
jgi:hypothetical protein